MLWGATLRGQPPERPLDYAKRQRDVYFNEADVLAFSRMLRERWPEIRIYPWPFDTVRFKHHGRLVTEAELHALEPFPDLIHQGLYGVEIVRCPPGWRPEWRIEEVPEGYRHEGLGRRYVRYRLLNPLDLVIRFKATLLRGKDGSIAPIPGGPWIVYDVKIDRELVRWAGQVWRMIETIATNKHPFWGPYRRDMEKVYPKENLVRDMGWYGWNLIEEQMALGLPIFSHPPWMRELGTKPWPPCEGVELGA